ncbi:MAG: CDP-diacylglycerol--glycerol-3-phosphate 3-phosphatidyltransferase [Verrucomicrobiota bacterium]
MPGPPAKAAASPSANNHPHNPDGRSAPTQHPAATQAKHTKRARPRSPQTQQNQKPTDSSLPIFHFPFSTSNHLNLPNTITVGRLVLTAVFIAAVTYGGSLGNLIGLITFIAAAISDFFDGYFARKLKLVTSLGKLLDPLADKILVAAAFIHLTATGLCPSWITALIIAREFLVTGLRQIAVEKGQVIAADNLGKWKTTFQMAFCLVGLLALTRNETLDLLRHLTLWPALALTALSGLNYTLKSKALFKD